MSNLNIKVKISTRLLAYFLFVTILPLFFLTSTSALLLNSSLNDKLIQDLDTNSSYIWEIYNNSLGEFKKAISQISTDKLRKYLDTYGKDNSHIQNELNNILKRTDTQIILLFDQNKNLISSRVNEKIFNDLKKINYSSIDIDSLINHSQNEKTIISTELISLQDLLDFNAIKNKKLKNMTDTQLGFLAQTGIIRLNTTKKNYYLFIGHIINQNSSFFTRIKDIYGPNIVILHDNNVLLSNFKEKISNLPLNIDSNEFKTNNLFNKQLIINEKKYRSSIYSINNVFGKEVGNFLINIQEEDFDKLRLENSMLIFEIALLVALAGISLAYLLARTITKPLSVVTDAAKAIENGDFSKRVKIQTTDELGYLAQSFNSMASALQHRKELEQTRDDLVATLTHDLRVPLLASVQTLKQIAQGSYGNLSEKQVFIIEQLISNNNDLLKMVNTILDSYKYEAGKQTLVKRKINVIKLIEECINDVGSLSTEKKHGIMFIANTDKIEIIVDRQEIKRVIINLLSNAITYTPEEGKIKISIQNTEEEITISIEDNGIGISESSIASLFERFSRTNKTLRKVGTGLGLYLSKQIIEAHNGKIWVESVKDQGSTFYFSLPFHNKGIEDNE